MDIEVTEFDDYIWYTVELVIDIPNDTYSIGVDDFEYISAADSRSTKNQLTRVVFQCGLDPDTTNYF